MERTKRPPSWPSLTVRLRVISHDKLRSASDPARRRSKRLRDLADAHALLDRPPCPEQALTSEQRDLLECLPQSVLSLLHKLFNIVMPLDVVLRSSDLGDARPGYHPEANT